MNKAQNVLFNLNALKGASAIRHKVTLVTNPDGTPKSGVYIVGKNSTEFRAHQRELRAENLVNSAEREEAIDTKKIEGALQVVEGVDAQNLRTACAVTVGWFGFCLDDAGKVEAPFDASMVQMMYTEMQGWKDKVLASLEKEGNFMPT